MLPAFAAFAAIAQPAATAEGSMADRIVRFEADEQSLSRKYDLEYCPEDMGRMDRLYRDTLTDLRSVDFDHLSDDAKLDYVLLRNAVENRLADMRLRETDLQKLKPLIPFSDDIDKLELDRRAVTRPEHEAVANAISEIGKEAKQAEQAVRGNKSLDKIQAYRAVKAIDSLTRSLDGWYRFYSGYDPLFDWWVPQPYKVATTALADYRKHLAEDVLGMKEGDPTVLIGDPIGRDALLAQLKGAMIDYTPEELIAIAEKEYAWTGAEMKKASREMGFGDDWKKALEKVREDHVAPGEEPELIKGMIDEAIDYVTSNQLVTVPPVAAEMLTMDMMTPQRQLVNPFFTGGRTISVSFPTADMSQEQKQMSLRANNRHFDRATVFHELIPGHGLQAYYESRYHPYRTQLEWNPFWIEGWAFYWEMFLYDRGFFKTPEDRIGSLFWRMHRSARVVFSLKFHLGEWTPEQCVQYLVDKVGHERFTAEGEVRRSILGEYPPLYQLAYMMGALQFRKLHRDLVDSGKMNVREFHDRIMEANMMPIELVRAMLGQEKLTRDMTTSWRFYEP